MKLWSVLVVLIVLLAGLALAQQPCISIGRTVSKIGAGFLGATESQEGLNFFLYWVNNMTGGVTFNGTQYCLKLITYNDGSDQDTLAPLYNYMIDHQNIVAAFAPYGTVLSFVGTVLPELSRIGIPTLIPTSSQLYGKYSNAVGTLIPNKRIQFPCAAKLYSLGARYAQIIFDPAQANTANNAYQALTFYNINVQANISVSTSNATWKISIPM